MKILTVPFILGVIPARGGSKGVPGKNIRNICGRPLISYTIDAALKSKTLSDFLVSTDSFEISEIAGSYGAKVPFLRPRELATDTAKAIDAVRHALTFYEEAQGLTVDIVALLQPTNPLRTATQLDNAVRCFIEEGTKESLITISRVESMHPYYMYKRDGTNLSLLFEEGMKLPNRQGFPNVYMREGSIYLATRNQVLNGERIFDNSPMGYEILPEDSVNIDTWDDFKRAESMIQKRLEDSKQYK